MEKFLPWVTSLKYLGKSGQTISFRNILSYGMAFIAMNPTFTLFKINRI